MHGNVLPTAPPGPRPVPPLLPVPALQRLIDRIEVLVDQLDRTRWRHEAGFDLITNDRFAGAVADDFRSDLAGQLRRAGQLRDRLREDLDHLERALGHARALQRRHEDELRDWEAARQRYQRDALQRGLGPRRVPDPGPCTGPAGLTWRDLP
jgi:hypothetical protein